MPELPLTTLHSSCLCPVTGHQREEICPFPSAVLLKEGVGCDGVTPQSSLSHKEQQKSLWLTLFLPLRSPTILVPLLWTDETDKFDILLIPWCYSPCLSVMLCLMQTRTWGPSWLPGTADSIWHWHRLLVSSHWAPVSSFPICMHNHDSPIPGEESGTKSQYISQS